MASREIRIPGTLVITIPSDTSSDGIKGKITSKPASQRYADGWEALFGATSDGREEEGALKRHHSSLN